MVNVNKLEQAINDLDSSKNSILKIKDIVENITELQNSQNKLKQDYEGLIGSINEINQKSENINILIEKTVKNIDDYLIQTKETNEKFISQVNTLLFEMKNENSSLQRNFENSINTKLELMKSDINIENCKNSDLIFEKINNNIQETKAFISNKYDETTDSIISNINKRSKTLTIMMSSLIAISLFSIIITIIVLIVK